jgi:hypothetical protein
MFSSNFRSSPFTVINILAKNISAVLLEDAENGKTLYTPKYLEVCVPVGVRCDQMISSLLKPSDNFTYKQV